MSLVILKTSTHKDGRQVIDNVTVASKASKFQTAHIRISYS